MDKVILISLLIFNLIYSLVCICKSNTAATALMLPIVTALVIKVTKYNPTYNQKEQHRMGGFFTRNKIEGMSCHRNFVGYLVF